MLTINKLNELGINTKEGLERCLNNEDFYLRLVKKAILDDSFLRLKEELNNKNYESSFQIAHSLKGVLGNLSLTTLYNIVVDLTELLRVKKDINYNEYIDKLLEKREELLKLI